MIDDGDIIVDYKPNRPVRSASQQLLLTKPTRTVLAQCSFTSAASNIWNSLPEHLRQCCDLETFRRRLKTYCLAPFMLPELPNRTYE